MFNKELNTSNLNLPTFGKLQLPSVVKELITELSIKCTEIYLIGGFVRDMLLGNTAYDLDFVVVDADLKKLLDELSQKYDGNYFVLDKETEVTRFVLRGEEETKYFTFDFTPVRKEKLQDDFKRRDFTINTLAIDLKTQDVLTNPFGGLEDLKQKKIKAVRNENMLDDPLRILRAFRFAALLSGEIDNDTFSFIKQNLNCFNNSIASERIMVELWKILDIDFSFKYIKQMSDIGLLEKIFPELNPMRKVTPNDFHHLWLYDHTLELVKFFEEKLSLIPSWAKNELNKPFGLSFSPKKKGIAKLACLFHDIGKPKTWEIKQQEGKEKHTFYGHDKAGVELTKTISERLKLGNLVISSLSNLVRYHLRPFQLSQNNEPITERALYRFFRDVGEDIPLLLMLAMSDLYATQGPKVAKSDLESGEKLILFLFNEYEKYKIKEEEKSKKEKLLDGNEIMKLTGIKPSCKLGEIIKELDEAIGIGEVKTKEEAENWVKKLLQ